MKPKPLPSAPTRDASIRVPLITWLRALHPDEGTTGLLEEFKIPRPSARIDLALVNGEMVGFEIKSDADTLKRLTVQVPAFSRFFDRVSVVTTRKHLAAAHKKIPAWWGIILFCGEDGFRVARTAKRNRSVDVRSLLYALSKPEIAELARRSGRPLSMASRKDAMVKEVALSIDDRSICGHSRDIIRSRTA